MILQVKTVNQYVRFLFVRHRYLLFTACLLLWITIIYLVQWREWNNLERIRIKQENGSCWPKNNETDALELLEDVLEAKFKPRPGRSIFFHETSCSKNGHVLLNARQACAIESAAKWNKDRDVFVIFTANVGFPAGIKSPIIRALVSYPNIHFRNVNLTTYAADTPMENWFRSQELFLSKYFVSHTSDFLRYTSMYKFGGIYLDLDVVVQRNFNSIPSNFAGAEGNEFVAVGAIGFESNGIGHEIAELCARWGGNGPGVITRVLKKICQVKNTFDMRPEKCWQFNVLPPKAFYAVHYEDWQMFFEPIATEETLRVTKDSIVVHVWNKKSADKSIRKTAKTAYEIIANKNCPNVFQSSGGEFR